jgi:hypothetical protein
MITRGALPESKCTRKGDGMGDNIPLSGPIDLDALDDCLMSDHAPDNSMGLSDLDGFLTGIVVGPELILPSEWLPVDRDLPGFRARGLRANFHGGTG